MRFGSESRYGDTVGKEEVERVGWDFVGKLFDGGTERFDLRFKERV